MTDTLVRPDAAVRRSPAAIDPRIRARRIEVRRHHGRRRLRRLVVLAAVLLLAIAAFGIAESPLLAIDRIDVRGNAHTSTAAVLQAAGLHRGRPLVGVEAGAAARRIEALPWVGRAAVARHWSGRVDVRITERRPVAVLAGPAGRLLVDGSGRVLAAASGAAGRGLPVLRGSGAPRVGGTLGTRWSASLRLSAALPASLRRQVATVAASELVLRSGTQVTLCDGSQLAAKVRSIRAVLAEVSGSGDLGRLNVCVPSAPALTPPGARA